MRRNARIRSCGMPAMFVCLALALTSPPTSAQELQGWSTVAPEMVRQIDSLFLGDMSMRTDLVVDLASFDQVAPGRGWQTPAAESWKDRLGGEVAFGSPERVATETCRRSCPYEGEPRIFRLMELTRTLPPGVSRELGELPEGHLLAVIRLEYNIGAPGDPTHRTGYHEYFFVLDAGAEGGPRIAERVNLVRVATGGPL
jgi:hypothetical protein